MSVQVKMRYHGLAWSELTSQNTVTWPGMEWREADIAIATDIDIGDDITEHVLT